MFSQVGTQLIECTMTVNSFIFFLSKLKKKSFNVYTIIQMLRNKLLSRYDLISAIPISRYVVQQYHACSIKLVLHIPTYIHKSMWRLLQSFNITLQLWIRNKKKMCSILIYANQQCCTFWLSFISFYILFIVFFIHACIYRNHRLEKMYEREVISQ